MKKEIDINKILEYLGIIFSTVFISGINIALSGHLLGYILNLKGSEENKFIMKVPGVLQIKIQGDRVIAGFAAFSVSLIIVGFGFTETAKNVFITNLTATDSVWNACQGLAASISLSFCLVVGAIKFAFISIKMACNTPSDNLNDRVQNLIKK